MNFMIPTGLVLFWASVANSYGVPCPYQYGKVQCEYSYECIPGVWECDGIPNDCPGNTDEKGCPDCLGIYCDYNETFVPWPKVCDFTPHCKDASDEDDSKYGCDCGHVNFKCPAGPCIWGSWQCDHIPDCWPTAADEIDCPYDKPDLFRCGADGPCLSNFYKCDGIKHCPNGEDEQTCPCVFFCGDGSCLLQSLQVCNSLQDCPGGEDELNCPCSTTQFPCETLDNICVPWELQCDCVPDCPDGSDENNCPFSPHSPSSLPPSAEPATSGPGGPSGPSGPSEPSGPSGPSEPSGPSGPSGLDDPMLPKVPTSENPEFAKLLAERQGPLKRGP